LESTRKKRDEPIEIEESTMTREQLDRYRDRLEALARSLKDTFADLSGEALRRTGGEASGNLSNAPLHLADLGTDNFEHETSVGLLEMQGQRMEDVSAALLRIREGTYGQCQECGREIPPGRLDAVPYAAHCVRCADKLQSRGLVIESRGNL